MNQQQTDMFGQFDGQRLVDESKPLARRNDPETSKEAAIKTASRLTATQQRVVEVARQHFRGRKFTAMEIANRCAATLREIENHRKRVRELERAKIFQEVGKGVCPVNRNNATLFKLKD